MKLLLSLIFLVSLYSQSYLFNAKNEMSYLKITGDEYKIVGYLLDGNKINLKSLHFSNMESDEQIEWVCKFLNYFSKNLHTLTFDYGSNSSTYSMPIIGISGISVGMNIQKKSSSDTNAETFIKIIKSIKSKNLLRLEWLNQGNLDEDFENLENYTHIFKQLEYLSFNGTNLNVEEADYFLYKLNFEKLMTLDLSNTNISEDGFQFLVSNSKNYPKLENLILDIDDIYKSETTHSFNNLKSLILQSNTQKSKYQTTNLKLNKEKRIQFLDHLKTSPIEIDYSILDDDLTQFIYKNISLISNLNSFETYPFTRFEKETFFPRITFSGTHINPSKASSYSNNTFFIKNAYKLDSLILNKEMFNNTFLHFNGSMVTPSIIKRAVFALKLTKVILEEVFLTENELRDLYMEFPNVQFVSSLDMEEIQKKGAQFPNSWHWNNFNNDFFIKQHNKWMNDHIPKFKGIK